MFDKNKLLLLVVKTFNCATIWPKLEEETGSQVPHLPNTPHNRRKSDDRLH